MRWKSYDELDAWKESMVLVELTYKFSSGFPDEERYGLTSQIRRAVVSVPSNIAEGVARLGSRQLLQFLSYSLGSLAELETQIVIATNQGFASEDLDLKEQVIRCRKLIYGLMRSLKK